MPGTARRPSPLPIAQSPRVTRLARDVAAGVPGALEGFWAEVTAGGTPLVEPGADAEHRTVTFVVRGAPGDDHDVLLQANRLTDPARPRATVLLRVPGTDVLTLSLQMRADWRASYQLTRHAPGSLPEVGPVTPADLRRNRARGAVDPHARRQFPARKAMAASSVVELPDAPPQPWRDPRPGVPAGRLETHRLADAGGSTRTVGLYLPPGPAPERLLVLLDGDVWRTELPIAATLDNLVHERRIDATAVLLVEAGDEEQRWADYAASPRFLSFLVERALPWSRTRIPSLQLGATHTTIAGQSLGALGALWAAVVAPDVFGAAIAQSPSLWWRGPGTGPFRVGEQRGRAEWLTELIRLHPPGPRLQVEVGLQEWLLLEPARRMRDALVEQGFDLGYREFNGGHDHACWWGGLADSLIALHPPTPQE